MHLSASSPARWKAGATTAVMILTFGATHLGVRHRSSPHQPPSAIVAAGTPGNLRVTVPPVPAHKDLRPLCQTFLHDATHGGRRPASGPMEALILATGGTPGRTAPTTAWCKRYLDLRR
jgi:hypothetical protein